MPGVVNPPPAEGRPAFRTVVGRASVPGAVNPPPAEGRPTFRAVVGRASVPGAAPCARSLLSCPFVGNSPSHLGGHWNRKLEDSTLGTSSDPLVEAQMCVAAAFDVREHSLDVLVERARFGLHSDPAVLRNTKLLQGFTCIGRSVKLLCDEDDSVGRDVNGRLRCRGLGRRGNASGQKKNARYDRCLHLSSPRVLDRTPTTSFRAPPSLGHLGVSQWRYESIGPDTQTRRSQAPWTLLGAGSTGVRDGPQPDGRCRQGP